MKLKMEEEEEVSECSSGCQSGWTMYLDQSYDHHTSLPLRKVGSVQEEEEEEDLSMVSDASSGPPHFHEENEKCCDERNGFFHFGFAPPAAAALAKNEGKRRRDEARQQPTEQEPPSSLDDTASSHILSFSKNAFTDKQQLSVEDVLEFSCDFSATHFKVCRDGGEKKTW